MRNHSHKTTMNASKLVPFYLDEMLPGDTFSMDTSIFCRMSTPIHPVMDNAYMDYYYFFVPNRLIWKHWREFMGENTSAPWAQTADYQIPQITDPLNGWQPGSVADYMGLPTLSTDPITVSALPFRAYTLIWNEWFRSESLQYPSYFVDTDADRQAASANTLPIDGGDLLPVGKFFDYFTSALPEPQRGEAVSLAFSGDAPLNTVTADQYLFGSGEPLNLFTSTDSSPSSGVLAMGQQTIAGQGTTTGVSLLSSDPNTTPDFIKGSNLFADLSGVSAVTINQLRQAFQIQRLLELDARGGTRYISLIKSHFGVTSPDSRLQRPEYLGGRRFSLNMQQVLQTSSTDSTSPQGNTAAFSATSSVGSDFTYSATEHGWIVGVCCIRTDHTYQQGINRMWSRTNRYDFYWPALAHLGEQAILNKEIYAYTDEATQNEPFGYQERWGEYRYKPSFVTGAMRSNRPGGSLDSWHYADYYESLPTLSGDWLQETSANVDRTLAVQSELEDQFICDFSFHLKTVRPMPLYSVPGLVDHL